MSSSSSTAPPPDSEDELDLAALDKLLEDSSDAFVNELDSAYEKASEELEKEEKALLHGYTEAAKEFKELDKEIGDCDAALERIEDCLGGFWDGLSSR